MSAMIYIPGDSISIFIDGKPYNADASHKNFDAIVAAAKDKRWDEIPDLVNIEQAIVKYGKGSVAVVDGEVFVNERALHNSLTGRIIDMMEEGFDINPLMLFLENLMDNPSSRAVNELYSFLEVGKLPITEDGCFLAYKKVGPNYLDIYSKTFDNSIGAVCKMQRNQVDENKDRTCSYGLHFCSKDYLGNYGSTSGDRVMIVKINPRDVVAIPADYNNTKGRCCEYLVIGEVPNGDRVDAFTKSVYDTTDFGYEPDAEEFDDGFSDDVADALDALNVFDVANVELYHRGYSDGRKRLPLGNVQQYNALYLEGYKDGKGHKSRQY